MKTRAQNFDQVALKEINPIIKFLIISDTMMVGATGMLAPLFALFVEDFINGGDEIVVSIAMGIFLATRSLLQIPIATIIDKIRGDKDDFWMMVVFSFLSSAIMLLYLVISEPWQLFAVQFILGLAVAVTYPSYMALFTRHIDKNKEGTEWGIYFTLTDLCSAILAIVGGYIAGNYGFQMLIVLVSAISFLGALILVPIKSNLK